MITDAKVSTSVACRSCETALTLWQQSTCRVSKPRRGARAARVGRPRRGGHADPSRSSGLVSSRHPCACTFDSTIITRIAARVSKPCGVGALLAPHARPLPVAHPPSRCISLRWRRQACCFVLLIPTPEEYRVPRVNPGVTASKLFPPLLPSLATPGPPLPYRPLQNIPVLLSEVQSGVQHLLGLISGLRRGGGGNPHIVLGG